MSDEHSVSSQTPSHLQAQRSRPDWKWLAVGLLLGAMLVLAIRFATYSEPKTHYHANFAVYIDGAREEFKGSQYYQEVKVCDLHGVSPQARTHMHGDENGVVHVHDDAVTWGQFFENLGWYVGPDFIRSTSTIYVSDDTKKLNIVLNGDDLTDLSSITNEVIDNKDRLLLSYGPADQPALQKQYANVLDDAEEYNNRQDPGSCGGNEGPTFSERLKHLL